ncbi:15090_t:CDS:2, partial [Entrophospora sp. SA101]
MIKSPKFELSNKDSEFDLGAFVDGDDGDVVAAVSELVVATADVVGTGVVPGALISNCSEVVYISAIFATFVNLITNPKIPDLSDFAIANTVNTTLGVTTVQIPPSLVNT